MKLLENEIIAIKSKQQINWFCIKIDCSEVSIKQLVNLLDASNVQLKSNVAWILHTYAKQNHLALHSFYIQIAKHVNQQEAIAVNRNLLGCLYLLQPIKAKTTIQLYDICNAMVLNLSSPLAVRVNALYVMLTIIRRYPDFYFEFIQTLEIVEESEACSIQAALKHIHKTINKHQIRILAANLSK